MDSIKVIATVVLSVIALFVITKIMGHKQVSQLDFFDYISGITIGSIAAELANGISCQFTTEETALLASIFVQLGDTLATIIAREALCVEKTEKSDCGIHPQSLFLLVIHMHRFGK